MSDPMMGQKRERGDCDGEESEVVIVPLRAPQDEQTPSFTNGAKSTVCADVETVKEADTVARPNRVLSTLLSDTSKKVALSTLNNDNNSNNNIIQTSALLSGGIANWRRKQSHSGIGEGLVELLQSPTTHHTTTSNYEDFLRSLRREDFPGMEWGNVVPEVEEEGGATVLTAPPIAAEMTQNHPPQQQQPQMSIRIVLSDEMVSLYQVLLGAVASLVNTRTTSSFSPSSVPHIPTSVPIEHLLDIFQTEREIQQPNSQQIHSLITTICTSTDNVENRQYLVLSPLLLAPSSSTDFSLRYQSGQYRKYDHTEIQIRRRIAVHGLFYTNTARTATLHLDNHPTYIATTTSEECPPPRRINNKRYAFIISGIYVGSNLSALIASTVGVVDSSAKHEDCGDYVVEDVISWSDECQVIVMGWRGHTVLTQEDRRQLAVAFRMKMAGYECHANPSSIHRGQMYTLHQRVMVYANSIE